MPAKLGIISASLFQIGVPLVGIGDVDRGVEDRSFVHDRIPRHSWASRPYLEVRFLFAKFAKYFARLPIRLIYAAC